MTFRDQPATPDPDLVNEERVAFRRYTEVIGATVGHDAPAFVARTECADEFNAWVRAYVRAYGVHPDDAPAR